MLLSKKKGRIENKKRKIAALANVLGLNNNYDQESQIFEKQFNEKIEELNTNMTETLLKPKRIRLDLADSGLSNVDELQITDDQYNQLKKDLNKRKSELKNLPTIRLKLVGETAALHVDKDNRTPIFLTDLRNLLMSTLFGTSKTPALADRWCHLEKGHRISNTVVLVVEGVSQHKFLSQKDVFSKLNSIFEHKLALQVPSFFETCIMDELLLIPSISLQSSRLISEYGCLETALAAVTDRMLEQLGIFPVNFSHEKEFGDIPSSDVFSRIRLLLSPLQMVDEGYPVPLKGELKTRYKNYVLTKDIYEEVKCNSPMYAIDCEMCMTTSGVSELTRVSIIDEDMKIIYETLVRPKNKITDYLTRYSGITETMMRNVTKTLDEVQNDIRLLLPADAILIGQSLNSDLTALRMMHPYVIDTSIIFNISGDRKRKSKLQTLSREFLNEIIQNNPLGHDSIEDSCASMKLTKLKLSKAIDFGDAVLENRKLSQQVYDSTSTKNDRSSLIISSSSPGKRLSKLIDDAVKSKGNDRTVIIQTSSNKEVYTNIRNHSLEYALTLAHSRLKIDDLNISMVLQTFKNLDKYIGKIWESIAKNGLFVVVFEDSQKSSDGAVFLTIK